MKQSPLVLGVSLAANVALLGVFVFVPAETKAPFKFTGLGTAATRTLTPAKVSPEAAGEGAVSASSWSHFQTDDLGSIIARLRAAGFPPDVLRVVINQRFKERQQALLLPQVSQPYWKNGVTKQADIKMTDELQQLERERSDTMKRLLGDEAMDDETRASFAQVYGNLPIDKIKGVSSIMNDYWAKITQARETAGGAFNPSDPQWTELYQQAQSSIAGLLTPAELADYNARTGPASSRLKQDLAGIDVTEAEFRALLPLYDAAGGSSPFPAGPQGTSVDKEQVASILGADRYAEYQQATRPEYQQLNNLVTRLDLPLTAAAQVAATQEDIQQRAMAVRTDRKLTADARTAQLAALAQEASARITSEIGARGLEGYRQSGGQWLNQLQPRPKPAAKSP
ncbi:MAG TPA: hypothetical protein VG838_04540 [Opitutaceae bacterium]|nr:hypothetical protein [Opitutaceae bacterium]